MSQPLAWERVRTFLGRDLSRLALLAAAYVATGTLGLQFAFVHPAISLVWPPAGIALGAMLILGYRAWPWILGSATIIFISTIGVRPAALTMAAASSLEACLAAFLIQRYAGGRQALQSHRNVVRFVGLTLATSLVGSATLNALSLTTSGLARWTDYGSLWMSSAVGNFLSVLLVTPLFLLYRRGSARALTPKAIAETSIAVMAVTLVG